MSWALLSLAGLLEIAFAYFMKASDGFTRFTPAALTVGTAIIGIALLGDSASPLRILCIALILSGVIGLKLVAPD
jgi:quaternary ammonium compound-resistance protein SugE